MLSREEELRRLLSEEISQLVGDEAPQGIGVQLAVGVVDSASALERCREVLSVVLRFGEEDWPSLERWTVELPRWFVEACGVEETAEKSLEERADLSPEERWDLADAEPWRLSEWLEWLRPSRRTWHWLGASTGDGRTLTVSLDTPGAPSPTGALEWLLEVAGLFECPVCGGNYLTVKPYETWPPPPELDMRPPYEEHLGRPWFDSCRCEKGRRPWSPPPS
ncbi:hypothetical protein HDA39_003028 [Kribbella italica]|uniref:Uncharacterized protein n=1 Tax=Kribbella italica TaxID=1540520 RepID=A0A7W9MU22_9ACTN|nr:hypothetical protein [Kribbella italica]